MRTFIAFAAGVIVGLFAVAALANASTTVTPIFGGGTGTSTLPSFGQVLVGNAASGYNLTATSSLGFPVGGSGTVTSVTCNGGLSGGTFTTTGTCSLNLSNANTWTALQLFSKNASSTEESCFGPCYFGASATSSFSTTGALTLATALAVSSGGTGLTSTSQNWAFLGPTSGSGAPAFRAIVAADIPTLNQNTSGTAAGLSATLAIGSGGTNAASFGTSNGIVAYNGTSLVNFSGFTLTSTLLSASNATSTQFTCTTCWATGALNAATSSFSAGITATEQLPATSSAMTLDWGQTGPQIDYQIGGAAVAITVIDATNTAQAGSRKVVWICNVAGTAGALTWKGVEWIGAAPTQTTTTNQCDVYSFDITHATSTSAYKVAGTQGAGFQ